MLIIEEMEETCDVFDITVDDNHTFYGNGILAHNCEILLPTKAFQRVDDAGDLTFDYKGQEVSIPNMSIAKLANGEEKIVRYVTESDDILSFLLPNGVEFHLTD